jgi:hypothetical protein
MINYETFSYESTTTTQTTSGSGSQRTSCGTVLTHSVSTCTILANKNGVILKAVKVQEKTHFELYMDGELLNKFINEKTAKAMWKDFSA